MAGAIPHFDQIVFSGGGTRCFWHGGFMEVLGGYDELKPARLCGVSGGALSAAAWIGGREERCREVMGEIFARNQSNIDLDEDNLTPHQALYRETVSRTLDREAHERIADGPAFQVTLGCPPAGLPPRAAAAMLIALYQLDHAVRSSPHLAYPKKAGLTAIHVDAREAARDGKLVDLVCAAATIPPVFDIPEWEGQRVVDAGMFDKAPCPDPDEGETLLLLTRIYRNLPTIPGRAYVQPSEPVEADKIDFTNRDKIETTWALGRADGRRWVAERG